MADVPAYVTESAFTESKPVRSRVGDAQERQRLAIFDLLGKARDPRRPAVVFIHGAGYRCHGMIDDNVHFQDSVRLVQRLIELRKEDWELAVYPVEKHAFEEETSWSDEYRRILKLLEPAPEEVSDVVVVVDDEDGVISGCGHASRTARGSGDTRRPSSSPPRSRASPPGTPRAPSPSCAAR